MGRSASNERGEPSGSSEPAAHQPERTRMTEEPSGQTSSAVANPAKRRTLLTVSPGAGFTYETSVLLSALSSEFEIIYLKTIYGGAPGEDGLPSGEWFPVPLFPVLTAPSPA